MRPMETRVFKLFGISEELLEEKLKTIDEKINFNIENNNGDISLTISSQKIEEDMLRNELAEYSYGTGADTLESITGNLLKEYELKLSVAESCTGGRLSDRLTDVPGSSNYFLGGTICYNNESKNKLLSVSNKTLLRYGAVGETTALEMASGVRCLFDSDIGISVTGIAGPSGGTEDKPVGLVFIALSSKFSNLCNKYNFEGLRKDIKTKAVNNALNILRLFLLDNYKNPKNEIS
ncbi:MAG: nicotinamide-nucleotide amidohydrolase family protein [Actinobacteria bacterium]|nr:nicotinamide-nucleotide amidohydrolase family protein [Actinomycetota bacterium]